MANAHSTAAGSKPRIEIHIIDNTDWGNIVTKFDWKSMINGGFIVKCTLIDPNFQTVDKIIEDREAKYLREARFKPTPMRFRLSWNNGTKTPWRNGIVAELHATGGFSHGEFTFVAVDPISYYLNFGDASGKMYHGTIGGKNGVIKQVLDQYVPDNIIGVMGEKLKIIKEVDETNDQPSNWWMMRQDPKTFIASLLEWSSSFTKHKTSWIVSNGEKEKERQISIKIQETYSPQLQKVAQLPDDNAESEHLAFDLAKDVRGWKLSCDHLLSTYNTKLVTSGISAVSGEYFDPISDPDEKDVFVTDKNTQNKLVPNIKVNQGYTKPTEELRGWSYVSSVPEFNNAEPAMWYKDYISGRARQQYMNMLNGVMRSKITVKGEPRLYASEDLGKAKILLKWLSTEKQPKMMHGSWLLYGWQHKYRKEAGIWHTDVYLSRLDYNATGKPGPKAK